MIFVTYIIYKFLVVMKSHTSHDVLLLCPECHQLSNIYDLKMRTKLAKQCNAPFTKGESAVKYIELPELKYLLNSKVGTNLYISNVFYIPL